MNEFNIDLDEQKEPNIARMEKDYSKGILVGTLGLLIGTFVIYFVYTILFTNQYQDGFIELYVQSKTDTLYNTVLSSFGNMSNILFLVGFFALGIGIILLQSKLVDKGKKALKASGIFATLSVLFGIAAVYIINFRKYYIDIDPGLTPLEKLLLKIVDELIIAMGPIANLGKFLFVGIALVILGFISKKFERKESFKQRNMITPLFFLMLILLWAGLLIGDYVLIENYTSSQEELLRSMFLTTNITQTVFAFSGIATFTEIMIRITRVN